MKSSFCYWIVNAHLLGYQGRQQLALDELGKILAIMPMDGARSVLQSSVDVAGDWLSLGGLDLQINGALGLAFPDLGPDKALLLEEVAAFLWAQGVDAFLPTIVTTAVGNIHRALDCIACFKPQGHQPIAQILGAHLEGPFLNAQKRGAHPEAYLQPLTLERLKQVLGSYAPWVKVMTLAPELDESGEAIAYLRTQNITVSLGHSNATAAQAQAAFARGATMVTHAFNAMPSLHHREPGLLGVAALAPGVWCGAIADGQHVAPQMLQWLIRATNPGELFLVSDALAPLGLPDGRYPWDSRQIEVTRGTARLPDGTLSGTTLPLLEGVKNLVKWGICDPETAIASATETPRQALGLPGLGVGQSARQLLRWRLASDSKTLTWQRLWTGDSFPVSATRSIAGATP
ncbi:N-acetylglucosamine-6-phosphate deacetylase [Altericista sp. CCNU0014]|uniref:N-acetylglucosamine-6-phosphate deacetylase n=1 Tax=Altericista sp. CCNU0014 TaxID=3082949 RepID=UPI0038501806